jgi:SAM-dependent methyltransferase
MTTSSEVKSPITGTTNVSLVKAYDVGRIHARYMSEYGYDVAPLFRGVGELGLFQCRDTGYLFFFPHIVGDSSFYARMQQKPTYYMPWKWEHEEAIPHLSGRMRVLEVGCGTGDFLRGLRERLDVEAVGLELNAEAARVARDRGLAVLVRPLAEHAADPMNRYDAVCMFQVLEHIAGVRQTLEAAVACLAPAGRLVLSVPDNDSFVGALDPLSDQPPHHLGRWKEASLRATAGVLGLDVTYVAREPLQDYHRGAVTRLVKVSVFGSNRYVRRMLGLAGGDWVIDRTVACLARWLRGHTLLAIMARRVG